MASNHHDLDQVPPRQAAESTASSGSWRPVIITALVLGVVFLALAGAKGQRDVALATERRAALETELDETNERIRELERTIDRLRGDPVLLERLARERLGLAAPDDVVLVLPEE